MKKTLLAILLLGSIAGFSQTTHTLTPDRNGFLTITSYPGYKAGDTIFLSGKFKAIDFENLNGAGTYYVITNKPGETVYIGDSTWPGGSYGEALIFRNCHYIKVGGTDTSRFRITGSNSPAVDGNGYTVRGAYINLSVNEYSDNFIIHDISIRHGGTGIWIKKEIESSNPATWHPNKYLNNFEIYKCGIYNTVNEAMYIGHTATYWNIQTNQPYYPKPGTPTPDPAIYKLPIKLTNVKIHDMYIHHIAGDAIQTAAIDNLEIYNNEITDWAFKHSYNDNGGILIGGRVTKFNVHDNIIHDGWGEFIQIYADGGGTAAVNNNLMYTNVGDGISLRGTDALIATITNNTIAYCGGNSIRINGYFGSTGKQLLYRNVLLQPRVAGGEVYSTSYVYTENGGAATEGTSPNDNKKFPNVVKAGVNQNNFFLYPAALYGYRRGKANQPPKAYAGDNQTVTLPMGSITIAGKATDADGTITSYKWSKVSGPSAYTIVSPESASTSVKGLAAGIYVFRLTVTDNKGATAFADVRVTVNVRRT